MSVVHRPLPDVAARPTRNAPFRIAVDGSAAAIIGGVVAGMLSLLDLPSPLRLLLIGLFIGLAPGTAVMQWWPKLTVAARYALPPIVGLSVLILVTSVEAFNKAWDPKRDLVILAAASVASAGARLAWVRIYAPLESRSLGTGLEEVSVKHDTADQRSQEVGPRRIGTHRPDRGPRRIDLVPALLVLSGLTWVVSLTTVGNRKPSAYGLFAMASPLLAVSAGLAFVAGLIAAKRRQVKWIGVATLATIAIERLTLSLSTSEAIYPWTYKHVAVVDFIDRFHLVNRGEDIYQAWPGTFTAFAWIHERTGVAPLTIAHWFTPIYHLALVGAFYAAVRCWRQTPLVAMTATFIFEASSMIQQDYFSPQAMGYLLAFGVLIILGESARRRVAAGPAILIFAAITVTHQLTPYWLILIAAALVVLRRVKPWWLPALFAAMAVAYLYLNYATAQKTATVASTDPINNIRLAQRVEPVFGIRIAFYTQVWVYLALFLTAGVATLIALKKRGEWRLPVALAFAPVLLLAVQGYGGEAIFRIFLYASPGLSVVAARVLTRVWRPRGLRQRRLSLLAGVLCFLTFAASVDTVFGVYSTFRVERNEVAVWHYFDHVAPTRAVMYTISPGLPGNPEASYASRKNINAGQRSLFGADTRIITNFQSSAAYAQFDDLFNEASHADPTRPIYLVLSDAVQTYGHLNGILPNGATANLRRHVSADSRHWQLVFSQPRIELYQYVS